jgi:hypothetical protein
VIGINQRLLRARRPLKTYSARRAARYRAGFFGRKASDAADKAILRRRLFRQKAPPETGGRQPVKKVFAYA